MCMHVEARGPLKVTSEGGMDPGEVREGVFIINTLYGILQELIKNEG